MKGRARQAGSARAEPLSRERILAAAQALVAEQGLAALSTRKLGARLGCEAMAIYHHFPNKHHLLDAMVEAALADMAWPAEDQPPLHALLACLQAYRQMARRHAALFPLVATHRLNMPAGIAFIERLLQKVQAVTPDAELAARAFRVLGYYVVGAGLDETAGYARGPSAAQPVDEAFIVHHAPALARAGRWFAAEHWDRSFELGARALLAALFPEAWAREFGRATRP